MKIKYNYRSDWYVIFLFGWFVMMVLITPIITAFGRSADEAACFIVVYIGCIAILFIGAAVLGNMPTSIDAGQFSMEIKRLYKTTVIRYGDIRSMEITRELREPQTRGDQRHYVEILKLDIGEDEPIELCRKLNIDMELLADKPEDLKRQFDESEFNKLKQYIDERMPIA